MEGSYAQWQKEMMEEVHNVLKWKRVCDDKIIPVPDKIKDCNTRWTQLELVDSRNS